MSGLIHSPEITDLLTHRQFGDAASLLLKIQKQDWLMLASGYDSLKNLKEKSFQFNGYKIKVQFNPGRMASTSAKVDINSIKERNCFLCNENLPVEQNAISYNEKYSILCNPFPIFPEHFTITKKEHQPQRIFDAFSDMLELSKDLNKYYIVTYNGPQCGASAPDHLHFQAGNKCFIPMDDEFHQIKNEYGRKISEDDTLAFYSVDDGLRKFISIESLDKELIISTFNNLYKAYADLMNEEQEPMMNIVCFYEEDFGWRVIIYLRRKHRPDVFFAEDESKLILSPAVIDISGVCVLPREEDFNRITKTMIENIFKEVFVQDVLFNNLFTTLNKLY